MNKENKPLIEQECLVTVEFIDNGGTSRIMVFEHNGDDDCWDAQIIKENGVVELVFECNSFGGLSYGDSEHDFKINMYQYKDKDENGYWVRDNWYELSDYKILSIKPNKKQL